MQEKIIYDTKYINDIIKNIKKDWKKGIHIVADFDRTLTKAFVNNEPRPSLISVLRSEWILWEEYTKKAYELFNYYHPIEIDQSIPMDKRKKEMQIWWEKHLDLLIKTWLTQKDIEKALKLGKIIFREGVIDFFKVLKENNIPLIIISANGLWSDSINLFLQQNKVNLDNIFVISNKFIWDNSWRAIWYEKSVIHSFNKWETILEEFPEIYKKVKNRKNVILLGDSLWDPNMVDWFKYKNLIKIGFLNEKEDELLKDYRKKYDIIITWDWTFNFVNNLFKQLI